MQEQPLTPPDAHEDPQCDGCGEADSNCRKFARATYYDCQDSEVLSHTEIEDAIEQLFEDSWTKGVTTEKLLDDLAPVTVSAYKRDEISEEWVTSTTTRMMEDFEEHYHEDFGDIDGEHDAWSAEELKAIEAGLRAVIAGAAEKATVYRCSVVATREYSRVDVEAVLRVYSGWFEDSDTAAATSGAE